MYLNSSLICILVLTFARNIRASTYVDFINAFIKDLNYPVVVTEYSCNRKDSFLLMKSLSLQGYQINSLLADPSQVHYEENCDKKIFILRMNCLESHTILTKVNHLENFVLPYTWILYYDCSNTAVFNIKDFEKYDMLVDSDINICHCNEDAIFIEKIYRPHKTTNFLSEFWGNWTNLDGYRDNGLEKIPVRRRGNLKGVTLNTVLVVTHNDTLNHLTDKRFQHIDSIAKVNYVFMEHLSDYINITHNYSIYENWGYRINDSHWSGMVGALSTYQAEIGGTGLFMTGDRVEVIDYIAMATPTNSKFVFREPKLSYVANVFILPFDRYVWVSTISLIVLFAIILRVILKWENNKSTKVPSTDLELEDSIEDATFFSFGALCQQGAPAIPSSIPGRITTIMIYISLMFLYTSYSANIVALLQSSSDSIQTLGDLLKSRLEVGVDDTVYNHFYFSQANDPIRKALYQQKVAPPGKKARFYPIEEGIKRMREGLFAFHMEIGPGYQIVGNTFQESEKCGLKEIDFLNLIDPYLAVQKNLTYRKLLKMGMRKIFESGIQNREVGLIYTKKPTCTSAGSSFISVGIVDCYPAAVVLAGGMVVAFLVLIVESATYYRIYLLSLLKRKFRKNLYKESKSTTQDAWSYSN